MQRWFEPPWTRNFRIVYEISANPASWGIWVATDCSDNCGIEIQQRLGGTYVLTTCHPVTSGLRDKGINNMEWINREEWRRKIKLWHRKMWIQRYSLHKKEILFYLNQETSQNRIGPTSLDEKQWLESTYYCLALMDVSWAPWYMLWTIAITKIIAKETLIDFYLYTDSEIHVIIQSKHFCLLDFFLRTWKLKYIKQ